GGGRAALAARGTHPIEKGGGRMRISTDGTNSGGDVEAALMGLRTAPGANGANGANGAEAAARRLTERIAAEGLAELSYGELDSPFGPLLAASTRRGVVRLAFPEEPADDF